MSVKLGRPCRVGIWIEGVQNMDTKTYLVLGGRNKVKLRNSWEGHPENKDRLAIKKNKIKIKLLLYYYYYYYYYQHHHHHRISHVSDLAGKYSPILGCSNQQD